MPLQSFRHALQRIVRNIRRHHGLPLAVALWALVLAPTASAQTAAPSFAPAAGGTATTTVAVAPARPKIGLVLSGGGARGLTHVGVLKVLQQLK